MTRVLGTGLLAAMLVGCGGDPAGPSRPELAGTFTLSELRFDPQGVLPEVDIRARMDLTDVHLVLVPDGRAQLRYIDGDTGLLTAVEAAWSSPAGGVRVHFRAGPALRATLLSPRMTFDLAPDPDVLIFDGDAPDGVDRQRLVELVPEWAGEQLLDPVPGRLLVELTRVGGSVEDTP